MITDSQRQRERSRFGFPKAQAVEFLESIYPAVATVAQVRAAIDPTPQRVKVLLRELHDRGHIVRVQTGIYQAMKGTKNGN